jgi:hypothetical protein
MACIVIVAMLHVIDIQCYMTIDNSWGIGIIICEYFLFHGYSAKDCSCKQGGSLPMNFLRSATFQILISRQRSTENRFAGILLMVVVVLVHSVCGSLTCPDTTPINAPMTAQIIIVKKNVFQSIDKFLTVQPL